MLFLSKYINNILEILFLEVFAKLYVIGHWTQEYKSSMINYSQLKQ